MQNAIYHLKADYDNQKLHTRNPQQSNKITQQEVVISINEKKIKLKNKTHSIQKVEREKEQNNNGQIENKQ